MKRTFPLEGLVFLPWMLHMNADDLPLTVDRLARAHRELRAAIVAQDAGHSFEPHLASAIRLLRQEVSARPVPPEELLGVLRRAWANGDGGPDLTDPELQTRTAEIVRLLLGEYHKQERAE